jgi:hypothetical protein
MTSTRKLVSLTSPRGMTLATAYQGGNAQDQLDARMTFTLKPVFRLEIRTYLRS